MSVWLMAFPPAVIGMGAGHWEDQDNIRTLELSALPLNLWVKKA
jgi:hypothetical protein